MGKRSRDCFCGSERSFDDCCFPLIKGESKAQTALQLMKSRYSAFYVKNMDYLTSTTDPQTACNFDFSQNIKWAEEVKFFKLEIVKFSEQNNSGMVEFKAYFKHRGDNYIHHEISEFRKDNGVWYYREGKTL